MQKQTIDKRYSLRYFLRNQLLVLSGFIVTAFGGILFYLYVDGLDIATHKSLQVIGDYYVQLYERGEFQQNYIEADEFSIFIGQKNVPGWITDAFNEEHFSNHTLYKSRYLPSGLPDGNKETPLLLTAFPVDDGQNQLFAVYHFHPPTNADISSGYTPPNIVQTVLIITVTLFIVLLIIVLWIAQRFNQRVLNPMEALAEMAANIDQAKPLDHHQILQDRSETGLVAQTLVAGIERIRIYHQRENDFLQNASHELRTPITVLGSALDIIERRQQLGKKDIDKPLIHMRQAVINMKSTTEALLWLSRDEPKSVKSLPVTANDLQQMLSEITEQLQYLIDGRELHVCIDPVPDDFILYNADLLRIVLSNLIRNSYEHTFEGKITISVSDNEISINDTGIGLNDNANLVQRGQSGRDSFGLGLDIVARIADKKGWLLSLSSNEDNGCCARLRW
jgi:signal transduction histidine kinase